MSGLIVTAKAFQKILKKREKELAQDISFNTDMGVDPGYTLREAMENELNRIAEDFRLQCRLAVKLRDIAIEEGLLKSSTPPSLEESPKLADRYALITIRPIEGTCLVYFEKAIATYMERPWVHGAEYHFEQTGENHESLGNGFHVHIVAKCKKSIRVPEIEMDARKDLEPITFSIQIGENKSPSCPKPRKFLQTERDLQYALNYIRGDKHNEDKDDAVYMNEEWRKLNGLQDVYYVGHWDNRESSPDAVIIQEVH